MSPLELSVLMHCRVFPQPFDEEAMNNKEIIVKFERQDVLESYEASIGENGYRLTPKGEAWLTDILNTPMPVQQWVNDKGVIIE